MANPRLRGFTWWRQKWARKDWAIAATGFTLLMLVLIATFDNWSQETDSSLNRFFNPDPALVDLTLLSHAREKGAVCLDGSAPGYHFQKGFGSGANNWLLHMEGGGWCETVASCSTRKRTALGSSKYMDRVVPFSGILSSDASQNPEFFNWNKVKIRYCDGASFSGNPEKEFKNGTKLFFRGQIIWEAIMDELLSIGLAHTSQAILSGCSAGGLATLIHCDDFRELLPKDAIVKCVSDAGFFLDVEDISGTRAIRSFYHNVVDLQGVVKSLNKDCISRMEPSQCFFPQEFIKNIKTPVFLVNPAYDLWQIQNILVPDLSDPHHDWLKCKLNIYNCNRRQIEVLQGFRNSMLKALGEFQRKKNGGMFINSCFAHCQTWMADTWHSPSSPRINNKTIAESVGDWYFNRRVVTEIDCAYPCNPTCFNIILG
ncbi:pectin acetylesterase 5-like [Macadamia integrifolia]|uniref:pectin acetylesterase 5-like n=1 Tax=Macadamia integrifolia TaxID=60698 RepID=UPI001C4F2F7A|nr:pectin acetylesterase 5-like [Macadamia integrifolia]XP_042511542.1 pectin acetylesterase 5-like [Macadamia integrifolia]XP_042511543.1 pectin acetylesterase 5-like [Macadamia integrifolia]